MDAHQDLNSQFEKLAMALNTMLPSEEKIIPSKLSKDALVDMVKNVLRIKQVKYLLIFDNAETYAQVEKFIPCSHEQSDKHVLLTSRHANIWEKKVEIGKFKREESLYLIKNALLKENQEDAEKLANTLSDYPLGLTIAVAFIKSHPTTNINQYINLYLKKTLSKGASFVKASSVVLDSYSHDAQAALSISLKSIQESSPEALKTLFFMSLLNSKDIPEDYIDKWLTKTKSQTTTAEVIKEIYDQSLIEISSPFAEPRKDMMSEKGSFHSFSLHDLIHQLMNESIPMDEKKKLLEPAIDVMLEIFSGQSDVFAKKIIREPIHLLHAQKICENAKEVRYSSPQLIQIKICIFECLMGSFRDFEKAKLWIKDIEEDLKLEMDLDPYYEALFVINKGFLEVVFTNLKEAIHYMKQGLSILNSLDGYDEERLRVLTNLAQYYALNGETEIAEDFILQGAEIFKKSKSEVFNCLFLFGWSSVLVDQGKFEESIKVLDKAKAYPTLGINYPVVEHSILHRRADIFITLGKLEQARKLLEECEEKTKAFFQKRKSSTLANIYVIKSLLLIKQNNVTPQVFKYLIEALEIYNGTYNGAKKHRNQGRIHLALGKAHAANKNFEKALQTYLLSEEIYSDFLKEKKIDEVSDLYKELATLGVKMKDEELTHKYLKEHIHIFGLEHTRTKEIVQYLDARNLSVFN